MIKFDTLYKRTETGAIQLWYQEVDGDKYRSISGHVDGKKVVSEWRVAKPKNTGKKNGTTGEEQAIAEVKANYKKRLKQDYFPSIDDIDKETFFKPMLAAKFEDVQLLDIYYPMYVQPKLDGMRCIATINGLFSRNGERWVNVPHIENSLKPLFESYPDLILDGELYNHDYADDFNTLSSAIKKTKPNPKTFEESARIIQYHIYDGLIKNNNKLFPDRIAFVQELISSIQPNSSLVLVNTYKVNTIHEIDHYYEQFLDAGYEGQMIRLNDFYHNKRMKSLLKRKEFIDEEYIVKDIQEGVGNWSGKAKRAFFETKDGKPFNANIKGTMAFTEQLLKDKDKFIGKPATVTFFNYTPDGIPRFGRVKEFNRRDM